MQRADPAAATRVLIVEDEAIIAEYLRWRLDRLGFEVVGVVDSGAAALLAATAGRPELVLMDIVLQGPMDGVETAEALAAQMDVPIIFLTAHSDDATLQRAKRVAPHGYLVKPVEERGLRTAIELALERHRREADARLAARAFASAALGMAIIDRAGGGGAESTVVAWNTALERMSGHAADEALGRPATLLYGAETDPAQADGVRRAMAEERAVQCDLVLHRKDGAPFRTRLMLSPVRDAFGRAGHFLAIYADGERPAGASGG